MPLCGENYTLNEIKNDEIVRGLKGQYFYVNMYEADYYNLLTFKGGKYVLKDFEKYNNAFNELKEKVLTKLKDDNNYKYKVFIKGSADAAGNETFKTKFAPKYRYDSICYYKKFEGKKNFFAQELECKELQEPITNEMLPNLRAQFLFEKYTALIPAEFETPIILDGSVELEISSKERNAAIILYFSKK